MLSRLRAKIAFALALLLLCISGIAAGFVIVRLHRSETLVRHTYDVEVAIGDLESSLTEVGRSRVAYIDSGTLKSLKSFSDAVNNVTPALANVRQLTRDNPIEQALCDRLEATVNQRVAVSRGSVELKQQNKSDPEKQFEFTSAVAKTAFDTAAVTQQMKRNEDTLLEQRSRLSDLLFSIVSSVLLISFLLSACMFWLHYRLLNNELRERRSAENQLRQLSLQLMRVQDEEHRRFARELHDGLGQSLAAAKMMVHVLPAEDSVGPQIAELAALLDDAISQTRTISHLFHPPFLDEIGFASAATWLIEGYAQRMGVKVAANIPRLEERLPRDLELTLYRVLQESLNNIQRHSKSARAEVNLEIDPKRVTLRVRDYGHGIPQEKLAGFQSNKVPAGVGLTGMKERVKEQGGELEIRSNEMGTEILVRIPVNASTESSTSIRAESVL